MLETLIPDLKDEAKCYAARKQRQEANIATLRALSPQGAPR
jgi:hypothetical protein